MISFPQGKDQEGSVVISVSSCIAVFVSCRHDVVMTTREYAVGRRCIPWSIPCVFALRGRGIFPPCQHLLCEAAGISY